MESETLYIHSLIRRSVIIDVCKLYSQQRAVRVKRVVEKKRMYLSSNLSTCAILTYKFILAIQISSTVRDIKTGHQAIR